MIIAFDIDNTLIDQYDRPRWEIIYLLHFFVKNREDVVVWSGGGIDYCINWCNRLGILDFVRIIEKGSLKADLSFDDEKVDLAILNCKVLGSLRKPPIERSKWEVGIRPEL